MLKKVTIKTNTTVKKIAHKDGRITEVLTDNGSYRAHAYIIATGGQSHPETGSTGDGFRWLAQLGHTVKKPTPTIVPLAVDEDWVTSLAGISLSFMKISFFLNGKRKISKKDFSAFRLQAQETFFRGRLTDTVYKLTVYRQLDYAVYTYYCITIPFPFSFT